MVRNKLSTFVLDGKEYDYIQAMKILMKGYTNTIQNRKIAHAYLMWRCKKPCHLKPLYYEHHEVECEITPDVADAD